MYKNINKRALDDLNWSILKELCNNARISNTEIGRRVGLSAPAVAERISRMEELGFIRGHHTALDFDKIGLTIKAFITVSAKSIRHAEMVAIVEALPEVIEWYTITGNAYIMVKVVAPSSKELENVIERLQEVGETSTSLILSTGDESENLMKIFRNQEVAPEPGLKLK